MKIARFAAPALAAVVIASALGDGAQAASQEKFGKTLVTTYTVPREALDRFNALKSSPSNPKLSPLENMIARKSESWQANAPLQVSSKANPYRIAIRYEGEITGDQGAVTLWNGGWFREGSMQTSEGTVATLLAGLNVSSSEGKRETRVTRVGAAGPVSFRYDGPAFPSIEVNRLEGLKLDRVGVEVWSGLAEAGWKDMLFGWQGALVGVVMLALWFVGFRRRD